MSFDIDAEHQVFTKPWLVKRAILRHGSEHIGGVAILRLGHSGKEKSSLTHLYSSLGLFVAYYASKRRADWVLQLGNRLWVSRERVTPDEYIMHIEEK